MKYEKKKDPAQSKKELKQEPQKDEPVQKGYNERNPHQAHGAFFPDSRSSDKKDNNNEKKKP